MGATVNSTIIEGTRQTSISVGVQIPLPVGRATANFTISGRGGQTPPPGMRPRQTSVGGSNYATRKGATANFTIGGGGVKLPYLEGAHSKLHHQWRGGSNSATSKEATANLTPLSNPGLYLEALMKKWNRFLVMSGPLAPIKEPRYTNLLKGTLYKFTYPQYTLPPTLLIS